MSAINRVNASFMLVLAAVLVLWVTGFSSVPSLINYQGRLTDSAGNPVPDGTYSVTFAIYDAPSGGNILWSELQDVTTTDGLFAVLLGSVNPVTSSAFQGNASYLSIQIGANPEQLPRQRFVSSAYSFRSEVADAAQSAKSVDWTGVDNIPPGFADGIDDAGVGDAVLAANQTFTGENRFDDLVEFGDSTMKVGSETVLIGRDQVPFGNRALQVLRHYDTSNLQFGTFMNVTNNGTGDLRCLVARSLKYTPEAFPSDPVVGMEGSGFSDSGDRFGVRGHAETIGASVTSNTGYGVYGDAWFGHFGYGVEGAAVFNDIGFGLHGVARHSNQAGYGALCEADTAGTSGYGVYAEARKSGSAGFGVYAYAISNGNSSYGIYARASNNSGNGYGVYGYATGNSLTNWAGYFAGDVNVTGSVVSPVKITKLDHPLDPENKYLQHSAIESSEMLNSYSGNVVLDASGQATVTLPNWFEAINTDYRYQLTCVGGYAQVYVASEIENGAFRIAGGTPGLKVSWEVKALRADAYAKANPLTVEVAKRADEQGKYLHPEAYGLAAERGIDYETNNAGTESQ